MPEKLQQLIDRWHRMAETHEQTGNTEKAETLRSCALETVALFAAPVHVDPKRNAEL